MSSSSSNQRAHAKDTARPSRSRFSAEAPTEPAPAKEGAPPASLRASRLTPVAPTSYRVLGEFAHGGIGRILRARDERLNRVVALKELLNGGHDEERFVREALVTARLQHPSIVPVYEAGRWPNGDPFYAMKLVSGRSLAEVIEEAITIERRLALLPHVLAVAEAMAYAHSQRIIHRDLKPANVLIGEFGETVVIDWGLAKNLDEQEAPPPLDAVREIGPAAPALELVPSSGANGGSESAASLTITGSVMGTPAFMPPEQAAGSVVDERADVYALGAILYHMLAGGPPYDGSTSMEILKRVLIEPPTPLEQRQKGVPEDLLTIVRKAMARDLTQRYRTAKELADDLRRFQTGQIVGSHRYSMPERVRRFVRRHKAAVSVAAFALALFWVGATISVRGILEARKRAEAERDRAATKQTEAEASQREATERADELTLVEARASLSRDPNASLAWLKSLSPAFKRWGAARIIAADAVSRGIAKVLRGHTASVNQIAFSPDGEILASASDDRTVRFWDLEGGKHRVFTTYTDESWTLGFSPDGKLLASGAKDTILHLWDLATETERQLKGHNAGIGVLSFSPDGRYIATRGERERSMLWDVKTGESITLSGVNVVAGITFSPDSKTVGFRDGTGFVLHETESGKRRPIPGPEAASGFMAFSNDGKRVAMAEKNKKLRVVEIETGEAIVLSGHEGEVHSFVFPSAPPNSVISSDNTGEVRLWDLATGSGRTIGKHEGIIYRLALSPNRKTLATAGGDRTLRLWNLESGASQVFRGFEDGVYWVAFSPDGAMVAGAGLDSTVRVWRTGERDKGIVIKTGEKVVRSVVSPGGQRVANLSEGGALRVLTLPSAPSAVGAPSAPPPIVEGIVLPKADDPGVSMAIPGASFRTLAFSPDTERLAVGRKDGTTQIFPVSGGDPIVLRKHDAQVLQVEFSPDGGLLITGSEDGTVRVWNTATGDGKVVHKRNGLVSMVGFLPDGKRVFSGGKDGVTILSDVTGANARAFPGHQGAVLSFALSKDELTFITGGLDHTVRLWNIESGKSAVHDASGGGVHKIMYMADGKTFMTLGFEPAVRLWDARTGESRGALRAHAGPINDAVLAPDGRRMASTGSDRTVRLWDLESGESRVLATFGVWVGPVAFAPDGASIIASSGDGTVRRWSDDLPFDPEGIREWLSRTTPETINLLPGHGAP